MPDQNPGTPEVAPPGQVERGREGDTRPLTPGKGLEVGSGDPGPDRGPKAPPFGVVTEPGGAGTNPRT